MLPTGYGEDCGDLGHDCAKLVIRILDFFTMLSVSGGLSG